MHFINLNLQDEWLIITPEELHHTCKLLQIWKSLPICACHIFSYSFFSDYGFLKSYASIEQL